MGTFSGNARTLAGLSARALGWTPDTFWNATPEELAASLGTGDTPISPPTRAEIAALIERDANGR
ncbi:phage tail assembly chaperone [Qipengyuania sp. 1NDH17]|uniref:Phage tail assembly chaperone n=1 Tax=Qipengyuania polymorpha TaxID=2867234 RepID=A0ABS7J318_9SPHN|nr:phage tail assembly chaperone [Qipengyuania polymorpha]MBX7458906.1 phage tail assembly chaperone [Qipengyuania polymorpha]